MDSYDTLKVPKDKISVMVHLEKGEKLEGLIFLEDRPYVQRPYQKVISFIEDENLFFPLVLNGGGRVEFINKTNILMLECAPLVQEEADDLYIGSMHIEKIIALFVDGTSISGSFMAEVQEDKDRLSDCLNLQNRFLKLKVEDKFFFLNKMRLQKVMYADRTS